MIGDQEMTRRTKLAICGLCVLTGCAVGQAIWPAEAHADESTFINDVAAHGVPADEVTLTVGHQVCSSVSAYGTAGLDAESELAINAGVSAHDAAVVITSAIWDLCPSNMPAYHAWLATPVSES
jgi:hypothetical protein